MKGKTNTFYVLAWDFNTDKLVHYDVLPHFRDSLKIRKGEWKKSLKSKRFQKSLEDGSVDLKYYKYPETKEELTEFIKSDSLYYFWGKCEHEMIIHGWPVKKNDYKIDVHEQVKMNLDVIVGILWNELFVK